MFIVDKLPNSLSAESYRSLRTSIKFSSVDKHLKTILVTSALPQDGKSTIAGNLAFSLSQEGSRVLIMDCDLRNPCLHKKFNLSNEKGLTDILVGDYQSRQCIQEVNDKLYLLTAGTTPPNPAEMVGSKALERLIHEVSINFDYIVIDTPPVLPVTDAQLLAAKADATVFVVKSGKTKTKNILQAYEELKKVNANVIGSVLNASENKMNNKIYKYYGNKKKGEK